MPIKNIFEFSSFRDFLTELVGPKNKRSGAKGQIASALKCQSSYISRVLSGLADLSLEQADSLATYLNLIPDERDFLLLLLSKDRAGSHSLKQHFSKKIDLLLKNQQSVREKLKVQENLAEKYQAKYYSAFKYLAIHVACTIVQLRTPAALAKQFKLEIEDVMEALEFLTGAGLLLKTGDEYSCTLRSIFVDKSNPLILGYHSNIRLRAIDSVKENRDTSLHYSAVATLSEKDFVRIKERLLNEIRDAVNVIKDSNEEKVCALAVDFFYC